MTLMLRIRLASKLLLAVLLAAGLAALAAKTSNKRIITPKGAPTGRPLSAGIAVGDTLYVSGQTGTDPKTQKLPEKFEDEVRQCMENAHTVLEAGGMNYSDVVAVQVYLTDMDEFQRMNGVYTEIFKEPRPTRTTVGVARLSGGAHMEITMTARK
jgi:2-iminobutanoate/2-iminopropanoate deaminase